MKTDNIVTHFDVSDNLSKLVRLLDTCYQMNYQHSNNSSVIISIDIINNQLKKINDDLLECIDAVEIIL